MAVLSKNVFSPSFLHDIRGRCALAVLCTVQYLALDHNSEEMMICSLHPKDSIYSLHEKQKKYMP